ncbi:MAG TPA: bacteriohemerythrin [Bryobacteraceae bacterium]|nr:bacteriohemerythrin [Bryobacteraceae bacterium]
MSPFEWKSEYSVGCTEIDKQHQQLFAMAGELHRAMLEARGSDVLASLLNRLVDYTSYHFASEERQMRHFAYPGYEHHQQEHAKLTAQVLDYQQQVVSGRIAASVGVMMFLSEWLKNHIQQSDQKLGAHLRARSRASSAA